MPSTTCVDETACTKSRQRLSRSLTASLSADATSLRIAASDFNRVKPASSLANSPEGMSKGWRSLTDTDAIAGTSQCNSSAFARPDASVAISMRNLAGPPADYRIKPIVPSQCGPAHQTTHGTRWSRVLWWCMPTSKRRDRGATRLMPAANCSIGGKHALHGPAMRA